MSKGKKKGSKAALKAAVKAAKMSLEERVKLLEDVVMQGRQNNWRLRRELDEVRFSIPLDVWRNRLRFVYPDLDAAGIEELVAEEAQEREAWLLNQVDLMRQEVLAGDKGVEQ